MVIVEILVLGCGMPFYNTRSIDEAPPSGSRQFRSTQSLRHGRSIGGGSISSLIFLVRKLCPVSNWGRKVITISQLRLNGGSTRAAK